MKEQLNGFFIAILVMLSSQQRGELSDIDIFFLRQNQKVLDFCLKMILITQSQIFAFLLYQFKMSTYYYQMTYANCTTDTVASTCPSKCCSLYSGGVTENKYSICITPSELCSTSYFSRQRTFVCTTDSNGNTCGGKCCSATSVNGAQETASNCVLGSYCAGYYVPGVVQTTTLSGAKSYNEVVEGGLATSTAIVVGITVPILAILLFLIIWFFFKVQKGNRALQGVNTDISGRYNETNMASVR